MRYFDHNATSVLLPEAQAAWVEAAREFIGNPSSPHRLGARAAKALDDAREELAGILRCDPLDIILTSGATESNNTVLHHFARCAPEGELWLAGIEHPCVIEAAKMYFPRRHRWIPVLSAGGIDLQWLGEALMRGRPSLIAVMAANNETGVLQPWKETLALCRAANVPFFCDATQWVGKLPAAALGECDFVAGSGHKFGGPRGIGFLKSPAGKLQPLLVGGAQEEARRAGTENVPGVVAMLAALRKRETALANGEMDPRRNWKLAFEQELNSQAPGAMVVGQSAERLWNTSSVLMPPIECQQRWVVKLDKIGFAVSTGSACASGKEEPSHVLIAMGFSAEEASRALRFSSGWETQESDWIALARAVGEVFRKMKNEGSRTA